MLALTIFFYMLSFVGAITTVVFMVIAMEKLWKLMASWKATLSNHTVCSVLESRIEQRDKRIAELEAQLEVTRTGAPYRGPTPFYQPGRD